MWLLGVFVITIIDYGIGNLGSVQNMFKKIGENSLITSDINDIKNASKLLLPGVGSFDKAMENINKLGFFSVIKEKVIIDQTPIMGICLGMQLLLEGSEEGNSAGFGFIDGTAKKFDNKELLVPHMGWNVVTEEKKNKLYTNMDENRRFYFVHSFAVECNHKEDILTSTVYGKKFVSSFSKDNIVGVQFHPEKSHRYGMQLFKNFVENY